MKPDPSRRGLALLCAGGLLATLPWPITGTFAAPRAADLPQPKEVDGITWLSGGIGRSEQRALRAASSRYDIELTFSRSDGSFLTAVRVAIDDADGTRLLEANSEGPIFLVRLPPGTYDVAALWNEHLLSKKALVTGRSTVRLSFRWPPPE